MNVYLLILCFLSLGIYVPQYGMQPEVPKVYRNLNWREDIHILRETVDPATKEYDKALNEILDYAVDKYEWKKKCTLSLEKRKSLKVKLLRDTINGK